MYVKSYLNGEATIFEHNNKNVNNVPIAVLLIPFLLLKYFTPPPHLYRHPSLV